MSENVSSYTPGSIIPLATSTKRSWELGDVRQIATGTVSQKGLLVPSSNDETSWFLSVRSVERAGIFETSMLRQTVTIIEGEFLQLKVEGKSQGLELFRPLTLADRSSIEATRPTEQLLILHLAHDTSKVSGVVRLVELSKNREQYLFDGQLGVLIQGQAIVNTADNESRMMLRDTVIGSESEGVRLHGRGTLAVVSLDRNG
ncbi:HutD family protein [Glutamicibacter creatinolyticus]|uniref:HutD family protein n=1 Tax=Glutamicibacter creatinolyticus TaxID=162496 RepID=UPI0032161FD4